MAKGMPWLKWDLDDWCDDPELKTCSLDSQGLLPRLMQIMARSDIYGHLRISGADPTQRSGRDGAESGLTLISRVSGVNHQTIRKCLRELEVKGVLKRNGNGLYSQRMLSDRDKWLKRHEKGKLGGNPALVNQPLNQRVNQILKVDIEEEVRTKNKEVEVDNDFFNLCQQWQEEIEMQPSPQTFRRLKEILDWLTKEIATKGIDLKPPAEIISEEISLLATKYPGKQNIAYLEGTVHRKLEEEDS